MFPGDGTPGDGSAGDETPDDGTPDDVSAGDGSPGDSLAGHPVAPKSSGVVGRSSDPDGQTTASPPPAATDGRRRVCLLTGAGGLLGSAFCSDYADRYDIVAVCRRRRPAVASQDEFFVDPLDPRRELPENRHRVFVVEADLEAPGQIERVVDVALAKFGRIDLLVNNAGYSRWHPPGLVDDGVLADFERHFTVNVAIPAQLATRVARQFWITRDRRNRALSRNVVNVSSLAGSRVFPDQGQAVYAASKAALNQLTRHQAAEFATFGIRVNAIAPNSFPGIVSVGSAAAAIARLDEEQVTGQILAVDG